VVASLASGVLLAGCSLGLTEGCSGTESCLPDASLADVADAAIADGSDLDSTSA